MKRENMFKQAINKFCPRSGKRIVSDSLCNYKGYTVGFCNTGCRDDFISNISKRPNDSNYFDVIIKENELKEIN
ncbi:MAG: YHS domain-containing protein [Arcobacter sp.]|nr:MAG: YHS domain-containing protein [Arcobacter sp.]